MKIKHLFFCLLIIVCVVFFRKIPVELLFMHTSLEEYAMEMRTIILCGLIVAGCWLIARKYNLLELGGFVRPNRKNYWMLLLPVVFPGIMQSAGFNLGCFSGIFSIFMAIFVGLTARIWEETVFRGVIQGYLRKKYPDKSLHFSCIVSSILFALAHLTNIPYGELINVLQQVVFAFFVGLLLSALQIRVNNVWLLGVVHSMINFLATTCRNTFSDPGAETIPSFSDYFYQIGGMILLASPILIFYWLLLKTAKLRFQ